jgi:hypothetical protein
LNFWSATSLSWMASGLHSLFNGAVLGLVAGLCQWLLLRTINTSYLWPIYNLVIYAFAAFIGDFIKRAFQLEGPVDLFIGFQLIIILSGLGMWHILQLDNNRSEE